MPVTANNGTWSYTLPSEVATKLLDSAGGPPYSAEIIDVQNNAIVASAQENVIVSEGNTQPVITVNPINNATDIITPINALQGITVSGTETGFDGQTVTVDLGTLNSGPGTPPAETQFATTVTAQNGMWSANIPADAVLALPVDTAGYDIGASVQLPNGTGTDATFFAERNLQSERLTLTDTAAGLEALTAAQIDSLHAFGVSAIASTGPADTEFSAAQVKALENDGIAVSGPTGVQIELSDTANNVLSLLGGASFKFTDVAQNLQKLENVGVTNIDVQVGNNHTLEVHETVAQLLADFQHLASLPEPDHGQGQLVAHLFAPHGGFLL